MILKSVMRLMGSISMQERKALPESSALLQGQPIRFAGAGRTVPLVHGDAAI